MATEGLTVEFTEDGLEEIAATAVQVNERTENIGARRLFTIMERLLEQVSFEGAEMEPKHIVVDAGYVRERLQRHCEGSGSEPVYPVGRSRARNDA